MTGLTDPCGLSLSSRLFRVCFHSRGRVSAKKTEGYKVSWGLVLELAQCYFLPKQSKSQGQPETRVRKETSPLGERNSKITFQRLWNQDWMDNQGHFCNQSTTVICVLVGIKCFESIASKSGKYIFIMWKRKSVFLITVLFSQQGE